MKDVCRYYDPTRKNKCTLSHWVCRYWSYDAWDVCPNWRPKQDNQMKTTLNVEQSTLLIELGVDCKECHDSAYILNDQCRKVRWEDDYELKPNEFCSKTYIGDDWDMLSQDYDNPDNWVKDSIKAYIFTLQDLLSILSKKITDHMNIYNLEIGVWDSGDGWTACYRNRITGTDDLESYQEAEQLIDCIYDIIVWLKQQDNIQEL